MKLIFESEKEKEGVAFRLLTDTCPTRLGEYVKELKQWPCDSYKLGECHKCWIDALSILEVRNDKESDS